MADLGSTGFSGFDHLAAVARRTRELLHAVVAEGALPSGGADYIVEATLPHVDGVRDGFHGWLRADAAGVAELRYLIEQLGSIRAGAAAADCLSPAERMAARAEAEAEARVAAHGPLLREPDFWHLAALAHTRLALALLPHLPEGSVRFPAGRRTYADIPAPRGPAELSERIDELERELWRTATGRGHPPLDPAFRRTYGFFDASEQLAAGGAAPGFGSAPA
jgi:hypothetical protein